MELSGGTLRASPSTREGQPPPVATPARFFPIRGNSFVVEQISAEFDFCYAHRIICRDWRTRKALWQIPAEICAHQAGRNSESERDAFKQPSPLFQTCHTQLTPLTYGAASPFAKHPGKPSPPEIPRSVCASPDRNA